MKVEDIRLENLRSLVAEKGTIAAVAQAAETPASYLSQILNRIKSRTGKPRDVGSDLARKLETGCGKPHGWMDQLHIFGDAGDVVRIEASSLEELEEILGKLETEQLHKLIAGALEKHSKKGG